LLCCFRKLLKRWGALGRQMHPLLGKHCGPSDPESGSPRRVFGEQLCGLFQRQPFPEVHAVWVTGAVYQLPDRLGEKERTAPQVQISEISGPAVTVIKGPYVRRQQYVAHIRTL